jgi:hypothetical protein
MATRAGALIGRMGAIAVAIAAAMWATDPYFRPALTKELTTSQDRIRRVTADRAVLPAGGGTSSPRAASSSAASMDRHGHHRRGCAGLRNVLFTQALSYAFPAHAAPDFNVENEVYLLYMLQPVFGIAMARIFLKERRKPYFWPLAACAIVGVYLIVFPQNPLAPFSSVQHGQFLAALLILGAVVLWASGTVFGRYSLSNVSFVTTAAMRFTLALPVLLVLMLAGVGGGHLGTFAVHQIPSLSGSHSSPVCWRCSCTTGRWRAHRRRWRPLRSWRIRARSSWSSRCPLRWDSACRSMGSRSSVPCS